ncbi:precorrin-6A synthase (deacetylating) [Acidimicrobiaceae bacterium USS-CC1]|uniref:Precorrin-6A synthase (Deacetylating) n=1 Tax=Acidiferrimicrobium australe TaxID=2664430 RepID=A0ABW9QTE3_9ACTN|nr:precorrin-6A synthase (deacetylating) [Acidiferrimicrobium australe]
MRTVEVIGVGMGNPRHLTQQAVDALRRVDAFFVLEKGSAADELAELRRDLCRAVIGTGDYRLVAVPDPPRDRSATAYAQAVEDWTAARGEVLLDTMEAHLEPGQTAGILAWGDPAFYDSTLRVLDGGRATGRLEVEVVPGISSIQMLAAAHRISLTRVGQPLQVTTGRRLAEEGFPPGCHDVVVMLDGACSFQHVDPGGVDIYWGADLGGPDQAVIAGGLGEVGDAILARRAEIRSRRGWVMDTYLLRRDVRHP